MVNAPGRAMRCRISWNIPSAEAGAKPRTYELRTLSIDPKKTLLTSRLALERKRYQAPSRDSRLPKESFLSERGDRLRLRTRALHLSAGIIEYDQGCLVSRNEGARERKVERTVWVDYNN